MARSGVQVVIRYNKMPRLKGLARQRAKVAVRKAAFDVESQAKAVVPVDTGNLKSSIQTDFQEELTAFVGPRAVEYAIYVEYGTSKMGAQPYMRPAAEKVRPAFIAAMKQIARM